VFNTFAANLRFSFRELWAIGFGAIDTRTLNADWYKNKTSLVANALMVNISQPIISFLYLNYNVVITGMMMGREWALFATKPQTLRVTSHPRGSQTTARYLQLPFVWAFTQNAFSAILHWLVSQSYFPVNLNIYAAISGPDGMPKMVRHVTTSGFSMSAVMFSIMAVIASLILLWTLGHNKYKEVIPVVGSCSLAISAACHPDRSDESLDEHIEEKPLQWGVTRKPNEVIGENGESAEIGHCSLSSHMVTAPEEGKLYAGSGLFLERKSKIE
jgi:hypothetical protein